MFKTDFMVIGSRQRVASLEGEISLSLFHTELERVLSVKCLRVNIDEYLTWDKPHIKYKVESHSQLKYSKKG